MHLLYFDTIVCTTVIARAIAHGCWSYQLLTVRKLLFVIIVITAATLKHFVLLFMC